jgi:hypothetical protein
MRRNCFIALTAAIFALLSISVIYPSAAENDRSEVIAFVERLRSRHAVLTCQDVYKALFQYVNGMEHSVESREQVLDSLEREIAETHKITDTAESLVEFFSDDLSLCRLNIRPYMCSGGKADRLALAFYNSSQRFTANPERFRRLWKTFMSLVSEGSPVFDTGEAAAIDREAARSDYRHTFRHSEKYRETYHPSYRVIMTRYLEDLW